MLRTKEDLFHCTMLHRTESVEFVCIYYQDVLVLYIMCIGLLVVTGAMSHIVNSCPLTKFDGGLLRLHEAEQAAVDWLTTYGS